VFVCSQDHPSIQHEEWNCPLCAELADHAETHRGLDFAEDQIAKLLQTAEECADADVLQLIAQVEEMERWRWSTKQRFNALDRAINHPWDKTLGRQLAAIRKAYADARSIGE